MNVKHNDVDLGEAIIKTALIVDNNVDLLSMLCDRLEKQFRLGSQTIETGCDECQSFQAVYSGCDRRVVLLNNYRDAKKEIILNKGLDLVVLDKNLCVWDRENGVNLAIMALEHKNAPKIFLISDDSYGMFKDILEYPFKNLKKDLCNSADFLEKYNKFVKNVVGSVFILNTDPNKEMSVNAVGFDDDKNYEDKRLFFSIEKLARNILDVIQNPDNAILKLRDPVLNGFRGRCVNDGFPLKL